MDDFETVLNVIYPDLVNQARKYVGASAASDVVHEALLSLLPKRDKIGPHYDRMMRKGVRWAALRWLEKHKGSARRPKREEAVGGLQELDDLQNPAARRREARLWQALLRDGSW